MCYHELELTLFHIRKFNISSKVKQCAMNSVYDVVKGAVCVVNG